MDSGFEDVKKRAKEYFGDVNPAHDWFHVMRVYNLSEKLARDEGADLETVRLSALLHDIGRGLEDDGEINDHAEWGADEAETVLSDLGYGESTIKKVKHCVRSHRYSGGPEPGTLEAKVLSDADNLDALGATGIARTFTYGGENRGVIADPGLPVEHDESDSGETSLNHLQKKILGLKDRMYTDAGREIAEDRHKYVKRYVERFKEEMRGEK